MPKRFLSIWLPYLATDSVLKHQPELKDKPFVLATKEKGRMVVKAANLLAVQEGISTGKVVADARAILPGLEVLNEAPEATAALLQSLAEWCLRFAPLVAVDAPAGLLLDISGCPHLWGGEAAYLDTVLHRFENGGYRIRAAIADTAGTAWAVARFGQECFIIESGRQAEALAALPPEALRLEIAVLQRLKKLGFRSIAQFMNMPSVTLRRRFGEGLLQRLAQALGHYPELLIPVRPVATYEERLPCSMEPICTAKGISIALQRLLQPLCKRLEQEGKGLRNAVFKGYRVDGNVQQIDIGTNRASANAAHLYRLFEFKLNTIAPESGIELFALEACIVEDIDDKNNALWHTEGGHDKIAVLLDNIAGKMGAESIQRYLPAEHHWPERAIKLAAALDEKPATAWPMDKLRPLHLLPQPEPIDVMVPLPDYPPILFTHKGTVFKLSRADGPERIEQEWWIAAGQPRDYYRVEDEKGARYWLFRSGHYADGDVRWFLHGFFA